MRTLRDPRQLAKAWYILMFQIPWLPQRLILNQRVQKQLGWTARSWMTDADLLYYRTALEQPGAATAMVNYYRAAARQVTSKFGTRQVRCPVLVLWGDYDLAMTPDQADVPAELASDVRVIHFPASHWLPEHKPDLVNEALLEFLA